MSVSFSLILQWREHVFMTILKIRFSLIFPDLPNPSTRPLPHFSTSIIVKSKVVVVVVIVCVCAESQQQQKKK